MATKKTTTAADTGKQEISLRRGDAFARAVIRFLKVVRAAMDELEVFAQQYLASRPKYAADRGRK